MSRINSILCIHIMIIFIYFSDGTGDPSPPVSSSRAGKGKYCYLLKMFECKQQKYISPCISYEFCSLMFSFKHKFIKSFPKASQERFLT